MGINSDQMRYTEGPYSYEFIAERRAGTQWRIRDRNDNACGSAANEREAAEIVRRLNK